MCYERYLELLIGILTIVQPCYLLEEWYDLENHLQWTLRKSQIPWCDDPCRSMYAIPIDLLFPHVLHIKEF